jgi:hypothetical protein
MDVSELLAITLKEKLKIKGSQMGHTKKIYLKKICYALGLINKTKLD